MRRRLHVAVDPIRDRQPQPDPRATAKAAPMSRNHSTRGKGAAGLLCRPLASGWRSCRPEKSESHQRTALRGPAEPGPKARRKARTRAETGNVQLLLVAHGQSRKRCAPLGEGRGGVKGGGVRLAEEAPLRGLSAPRIYTQFKTPITRPTRMK